MQEASLPKTGPIHIVDPAMGDGALLNALLDVVDQAALARCVVHGYETDATALALGSARLRARYPDVDLNFHMTDFLQAATKGLRFDLAIANPPYVRTQVLGAKQSQMLAETYGLTGRVDLYYSFLLAIASTLNADGSAAIITSNRFLTTKSGEPVRRALLDRFQVRHVFDLGDTKLFDAAVLPAITIVQGRGATASPTKFSSIYVSRQPAGADETSVLAALEAPDGSILHVGGVNYLVRHGLLNYGERPEGVWRVATEASDQWLAKVKSRTWGTFDRVGKIRVGVKSTADKVFIRSDWDLPEGEPELLIPLLTRHHARRYRALLPSDPRNRKKILYPHIADKRGRRMAVDLDQFPKSKAYLERHKERLQSRDYVISAGRKWYEIWVPQDPGGWVVPKLVFPDISEKPIFWMDLDGSVVNGECYFLRAKEGVDPDLLWLALAVANSTFIEKFYDHCFNNKLYAGRRRWITQYVEKFPLPDPTSEEARKIIAAAKMLYELPLGRDYDLLAFEVDQLVSAAFGLLPE